MRIKKAGETLSYGIGNELDENTHESLKAFIIYLTLIDKIGAECTVRIKNVIEELVRKHISREKCFERLSRLIVSELKSQLTFDDFKSLVAKLNDIQIPEWVYKSVDTLYDMVPDNVYLIHELLYYIIEVNDRHYFRCIHVDNIGSSDDLKKFSHDYFEDFDNLEMDYSDLNHTISTKYSKIIGFNRDTVTFYLSAKHDSMIFCEFHTDTQEEIIHHKYCYGFIGNVFPVVKEGNDIAILYGDETKTILSGSSFEEYSVRNDRVYVEAPLDKPVMFKPYTVAVDGSRFERSHKDLVVYVMSQIKRDIKDFRSWLFESEQEDILCGTKEIDAFSLAYLDTFLEGRYDLDVNKRARCYHHIIKILMRYIDKDKDVLDYFFILSDISKRLEEKFDRSFIGEQMYWLLSEMHLSGKLSRVIHDPGKFKEKLMKEVYWTNSVMFKEIHTSNYEGRVGFFSFEEDEMVSLVKNISDAICIGDMLVAPYRPMPGVVSFNLLDGSYIIQYNRPLFSGEIKEILSEFHILDTAFRVMVEKRVSV